MNSAKAKKYTVAFVVIALISIAYVLKLFGTFGWSTNKELAIARSAIYIFLFSAWGIYIHMRIVQKQVRRYLSCIVALMVFWITIRAIKYSFVNSMDVIRAIWYLYYLPIIFIPLFSLMVAMSLGKAEDYQLPKKTMLLFIPASLLLLAVLTNDLHQWVFSFPADALIYKDTDYRHELGYYLIWTWEIVCTVVSCINIVVKCRIPGKKKMIVLPLIPLSALMIYGCLYIADVHFIALLLSDFSVVFCLLIAASLESFLRCGLIQSNTHYRELFRMMSIHAEIADSDYNIVLSSTDNEPLSKEIMRQADDSPVMIAEGLRLSAAPIRGGRVLWSEDVSELTETVNKLTQVNSFLFSKRTTAEKEYESSRRKQQVIEKKSLYDSVMAQTQEEIRQYVDLVESFEKESDPEEICRMVLRVTVICAYIKRKISLIFSAKDDGDISADQFDTCICKDSLPCICQSGAIVEYNRKYSGSMPVQTAIEFYKAFHIATMAALDTLKNMEITLAGQRNAPIMVMRVACNADLSALSDYDIDAVQSEKEWTLTVTPKGGTAV